MTNRAFLRGTARDPSERTERRFEGDFSTNRPSVEAITGRETTGFMSGNDARNDLASEIFVFAPRPVAVQMHRTAG